MDSGKKYGWDWDSVKDAFKDTGRPNYGQSANGVNHEAMNQVRKNQLANFELAKQFFIDAVFVEISRDMVENTYVETHLNAISKGFVALNIKTTFDSLYENNIYRCETAVRTAFDLAITSVAALRPEKTVTFSGNRRFVYSTADRNAAIKNTAINIAAGKSVALNWPTTDIRIAMG